jgi:hypothetical protein
VIGTPDPLQQPRTAFRRADIDHQVDVAPVDAEIERGRAHDRAQLALDHRAFDAAALRDVERAVMQRNRKVVVVHAPQLLEQKFRLAARVHEDQRGLVRLDEPVDFTERVTRRVAGPGQVLLGVEHRDIRLRTACAITRSARSLALRRLWHQKTAQVVGLGNRRGQSDRRELRRQREQLRQAERQQVAPLGGDELSAVRRAQTRRSVPNM